MTTFEKMGIEYRKVDGLLYPILSVDDVLDVVSVGKYGRMWIRFMKSSYPDRYRHLIRIRKIGMIANDVNEQAYEMLDMLQEKYIKKHKEQMCGSFMECVRIRNQAKMIAEEIVLTEVVNLFH